jgi:hypothetical protein
MKTVPERIAEAFATSVMIAFVFYIFGHVVAAWLRGTFEMVTR